MLSRGNCKILLHILNILLTNSVAHCYSTITDPQKGCKHKIWRERLWFTKEKHLNTGRVRKVSVSQKTNNHRMGPWGHYPRNVEILEKMANIFHVPLTYILADWSLFIEPAAAIYGKRVRWKHTISHSRLLSFLPEESWTRSIWTASYMKCTKHILNIASKNRYWTCKIPVHSLCYPRKESLLWIPQLFTSQPMTSSEVPTATK